MNKIKAKQKRYVDVSIKTYNVNYDINNAIMATESSYIKSSVRTKAGNDEEFNLINYISALHSVTIKGILIDGYNVPNIIEYNEDYLVVVIDSGYFLKKSIFDLRNVELLVRAKKEIKEIQDFLKK